MFYKGFMYLDSTCYIRLKDYYKTVEKPKGITDELNAVINYVSDDKLKKLFGTEVFKKLEQHLKGNSVFILEDHDECCKYVNYVINEDVIKNNIALHQDTEFKVFDIFMEYFGKHKNYGRCKSNIKYIDPYTLQKMISLYGLYDDYDHLQNYTNWFLGKECQQLHYMSRLFIDNVNRHASVDENLLNRLKEFKKLIEPVIDRYNCRQNNNIFFTIPDKYYETKVVLPEHPHSRVETVKSPEELKSDQQHLQVLGRVSSQTLARTDESTLPDGSRSLTSQLAQPELDINRGQIESGNGGMLEERRHAEVEEPQEEVISSFREGDSMAGRDSQGVHADQLNSPRVFNFLGQPTSSERLLLQAKASEQSESVGLLGKIQSTLSGIVSEVEPAPILGVSGGMGALFLLFKYTPFGSFFGGRRGRIRQIPSSFRGFPPGEFPNFQEYDSGFIGYAPMNINPLAE